MPSVPTCSEVTCPMAVFDAVRIRLLEIGEAVKALPADMLSSQAAIPGRRSRVCATT